MLPYLLVAYYLPETSDWHHQSRIWFRSDGLEQFKPVIPGHYTSIGFLRLRHHHLQTSIPANGRNVDLVAASFTSMVILWNVMHPQVSPLPSHQNLQTKQCEPFFFFLSFFFFFFPENLFFFCSRRCRLYSSLLASLYKVAKVMWSTIRKITVSRSFLCCSVSLLPLPFPRSCHFSLVVPAPKPREKSTRFGCGSR